MVKIERNTSVDAGNENGLLSKVNRVDSILLELDEVMTQLEKNGYQPQISQSNGNIVFKIQ